MSILNSHPEQRPLLVTLFTLSIFGVIFTALRLYAIYRRTAATFSWSFIWIVLSLVFALASDGAILASISLGMGRHLKELSLHQIVGTLKWELIYVTLGVLATTFGKFSIMALLMELEGDLVRYRRYFQYAFAVVYALVAIAMIILTWFECTPAAKLWNPVLPGKCTRYGVTMKVDFLNGALNVALDLFLSLYPIYMMWNVKVKRTIKIATCVLMAGGLFTCFSAVLRTIEVKKMFNDEMDITYIFGTLNIWTLAEIWLVIIIGSLPAIRPLLMKWFGPKDRNDNVGAMSLAHWTATPAGGDAVVVDHADTFPADSASVEKKAGLGEAAQVVVVERYHSRDSAM